MKAFEEVFYTILIIVLFTLIFIFANYGINSLSKEEQNQFILILLMWN